MVVSNLMRITKALPPPSEDSNLEAPLPVHKIRSTADILWDLSSLISESVHLVPSSSEQLIAASSRRLVFGLPPWNAGTGSDQIDSHDGAE